MENERKLEAQRTEAEREKLQLTLEHKEKELENSINQIVEKNNFLNSISNDMRLAQTAKSAEKDEMLDELRQKIRKHISSGAVTAMIYDEIESVHGEFMSKIKAQFPALTPIEVKIAALLRMKLTSANIASLLFISQRTVELHRLRIRKKMGLSGGDNLYVAMGSF